MANRLAMLFSLVVLAFCACSDDEDAPVAPGPANVRYVDADQGGDSGDGSSGSPWATITHAVATAGEDFIINVAAATYDTTNGETFPIVLKPGQQLIGDVANKGLGVVATRILGEGPYAHDQLTGAVIAGAEGARVAGFTVVTETDPSFHSGIALVGVDMEIDHNTFEAEMYNGIGSASGAAPDIHDNVFLTRAYGLFLDNSGAVHVHDNVINSRSGMRYFGITDAVIEDNSITAEIIGIQAGFGTATIRNNQFLQTANYMYGAIHNPSGSPLIRGNSFASGSPVLIVTQSGSADAGTLADPGLNDFSDVVGVVVRHEGTGNVMVVGNTWSTYPPVVGTDIVITGTGSVVWE